VIPSRRLISWPFAINGLGRIGRALLRIAHQRADLSLVAANDAADPHSLARLVRHDSIHGPFPGRVAALDRGLALDDQVIPLSRFSLPEEIPWQESGARLVVEATGRFRSREGAARHLRPGVERVLLSATGVAVDATFCYGINHRTYDPRKHFVVSNASCTTNCLAAVLTVLHRAFGIEHALMNTVHCVTNSQNLVDMAHPSDPRRARSAIGNLIPTTSDAIPSIGLVIPELAGRVDGLAVRVPIVAGSIVDVTARLACGVSVADVAAAYREAAASDLEGILGVTEEELVSVDFIGDPRSAIVDLPLLQRAGDRLVRVIAWYDNEWGYSNRLADLIAHMAEQSGDAAEGIGA
jgi:glyceraldehyde 3-phosphate dehydrogenase